jgi:hypothetical protein
MRHVGQVRGFESPASAANHIVIHSLQNIWPHWILKETFVKPQLVAIVHDSRDRLIQRTTLADSTICDRS